MVILPLSCSGDGGAGGGGACRSISSPWLASVAAAATAKGT